MAWGGGGATSSFHGDGRYPGDGGAALQELPAMPWFVSQEGPREAYHLHNGALKGGTMADPHTPSLPAQ